MIGTINFIESRLLEGEGVEEATCRQIVRGVPVETRRRDRGIRQPIERDVVNRAESDYKGAT